MIHLPPAGRARAVLFPGRGKINVAVPAGIPGTRFHFKTEVLRLGRVGKKTP